MCNQGIECLNPSALLSDNTIDNNHQDSHQAVYLMDSPVTTPVSVTGSTPGSDLALGSNDETPRVKFLCSFLGSILPRPQDGKLRYVGGETRILSLPREISYEELMNRMRELYEGAAVLKYQQPDEDLDALVSVVNDDDVTNMMEEYEKLGSGDGFTRLRIFLFSHPDLDGSVPYVDGDERETERRYVDALNNLNDGADIRKQQHPESPVIGPVDDMHVAEQFFNPISLEGSTHSQRGSEIPMPQYNLRHLTIPHMGSGQHQQSVTQRYNDTEGQWSPAYFSPRHHGQHDPRASAEFPSSPSSARYRMPFGEIPDKFLDRMPEEFARQQVSHHPTYDHQPQFSENLVWMPSDKAGFPGNLFHGPNVFEGNNVCEHCRVPFHRNQPQLEQPNIGNGLPQVANPCAECPPNRETFMLNADVKSHHGIYLKDQNDHRSVYSETQSHERGWVLQNQLSPRVEDTRTHVSGAGRLNDHYIVDGLGMNFPLGHGNMVDGHHMPPTYVHHRGGPELGNEVFHDQTVATAPHLHMPPPEERGVRYGNIPYAYGADNLYPVSHGHLHGQPVWRNAQNTMHGGPSYEASTTTHLVNGTVNPAYLRSTVEGYPRFGIGVDNQNPWVESSQKMLGTDGAASPEYSHGHTLKLNPNIHIPENQLPFTPDPIRSPHGMLNFATPMEPVQLSPSSSTLNHENLAPSAASGYNPELRNNTDVTEAVRIEEKGIPGEEKGANHVENVRNSEVPSVSCAEQNEPSLESVNSNFLRPPEESGGVMKPAEKDPCAPLEDSSLSVDQLSFIPELMASVKKAALEEVEEVKTGVEENSNGVNHDSNANEAIVNEPESANAHGEELDSDNDNLDTSKIEPTKAEAEAISRGLQTIKNDDLEEIRELGSGTYGAVYHGKWKGSDVAVKRIKASCFAGRPSERERLIADFWKEALILGSLHHPNVVSFYGIVRDGPDGSLATVTEFMVNGSLKQFLQKKDRTIDRRKRLIIAMDAAFGMEYLHGKNIVHFDLKCENLLVNMRDPQRPVCKIGDLGLSKVKQHTLVSGGVRGTLPWMAPELLSGKSNMVTEKIDVYSFGIVMWELLTGEEPYADMHCASIIGGIVNNSLRPQIPTWCDPEWKSLMESCWASDPAQRPSFSEISQKLRNMAAAINVK